MGNYDKEEEMKEEKNRFDLSCILVVMVVFNRIFVDLILWWIIGGVVC